MRVLVLVGLLVGASSWAAAQAPEHDRTEPPPASPGEQQPLDANPTEGDARSASERARAYFVEGMQAFEERRFGDAISAFRRASELVPSADLTFNIARAYEELGELDGAVENYRRYLRDRVDPPDREAVLEHIRELEERAEAQRIAARQTPTTGTLRVEVDVAGAEVRIDDRPIGTSPIPMPLSFGVGEHHLEVRLEGYVPFRARVHLDAGATAVAQAHLVPATEYRSVRGKRRFTWVAAALSGAAAAASLGLGIHARSLRDPSDMSEARRWARYSDYALGGAVVMGVGTVTLFFGEGRAVRTERAE